MRVSIHVATRDRSTELYGLLNSLRTQTAQNWDLVVCDGSQPQTIFGTHFIQSTINRIRFEGHAVHWTTIGIPGVCAARQKLLEEDPFVNNDLVLRIDDDTVLCPDYIEKLLEGINAGYDLVSGLTPTMGAPEVMRETRFVKPVMNKIEYDNEGNILKIGDDQAFTYDTEELVKTHHFRSSALYKRELHTKDGITYKEGLSNVGFREELFFSLRAILAGRKLAVHTGARYHHLQSPSGGCRFADFAQQVALDENRTKEWFKRKFKEKGDFLAQYDQKVKA